MAPHCKINLIHKLREIVANKLSVYLLLTDWRQAKNTK